MKVIIGSEKSKIPREFNKFMSNGDNKTHLIELISSVLRSNYLQILNKLQCSTVCFSREDITYCLQQSVVSVSNELASNQEEIDTKVIPHCSNSLNANEASKCILRSPSGDTDIFVLA